MARVIRIAFGALAGLMLLSALADILLHGRLTLLSPVSFGTLLALALVFLITTLLSAREGQELAERHIAELKAASVRLEASLHNLAAANARLQQGEVRYRGLVDAQGDAIFRRDAASRLTYANEAFCQMFGLDPVQAIGVPFALEPHPDSRAPLFAGFAALNLGPDRIRYDQQVRTRHGYRWIAWEDYAIHDSDGQLAEVQSVGRDITEHKALESALTEARDIAEAASRAKSGFLATMSHEIRTPMNGVLGMGRLLLETDLRADQRSYAEAITQSGEALLTLIGDILDFSKIESGTFTFEEDEVEIRDLLNGVAELLAPRAHAKSIEIVTVTRRDVPRTIRADTGRLRQVLTNLVGNAVKFTEKGGVRVEIALQPHRNHSVLRFEVRDTGVGVPPEKREDIFREFVQADSSHARKFGGSGLGLAISKRLVEAMGGKIGMEPVEEGGSAFWFTLPAVIVEAAPANGMPLKDRRIGIVTRNRPLRDGLTAQIEAAGGEVVHFHRLAPEGRIDAILVDAGAEAEFAPLVQPEFGVPCLVLLAPAARGKLDRLMATGFGGYLVKPIREISLLTSLGQVMAARSESPSGRPPLGAAAAPEPSQTNLEQPAIGRHVLLAEDNPVNTLLIRELLRRRGHKVTEVLTGTAAVAAMDAARFDLLLTDIHMPGMDGIEATLAIRANEEKLGRARTPIVALTADALETGRRACLEAGMDAVLTKPVDPAELEEMFRTLFPKQEGLPHTEAA